MIDLQKKLSNNNINDNTSETIIPPHSYPIEILIFLGIIMTLFIVNFFVSFVCFIPLHIDASKKILIIKKLIENRDYVRALQLHEKLCKEYPQSYVDSYGVAIAEVCFNCSQYDRSFFKDGINYLRDKTLDKEQFQKIYHLIPHDLKEKYLMLFNVSYRKNDIVKEYKFKLNNDEVNLL